MPGMDPQKFAALKAKVEEHRRLIALGLVEAEPYVDPFLEIEASQADVSPFQSTHRIDGAGGRAAPNSGHSMSEHTFAVGDLVTIRGRSDVAGRAVVWRVAGCRESLFMLLPITPGYTRPRSGTPDTMKLVEAWRGPKLTGCNADGSAVELANQGIGD